MATVRLSFSTVGLFTNAGMPLGRISYCLTTGLLVPEVYVLLAYLTVWSGPHSENPMTTRSWEGYWCPQTPRGVRELTIRACYHDK